MRQNKYYGSLTPEQTKELTEFAAVLKLKKQHKRGCPELLARTCTTPVECDHGYDCCPICDPCTYHEPPTPLREGAPEESK